MIANLMDYQKVQEEMRILEERLARLQQLHPVGSKGFTKAGIRKMIARLHEELAVYPMIIKIMENVANTVTAALRCNLKSSSCAPNDLISSGCRMRVR